MRSLLKTWRNGPGGRWDCRIRWFEDTNTIWGTIRLALETTERLEHKFFNADKRAEAQEMWDKFKLEHKK